jgi:tellurite resistance protein
LEEARTAADDVEIGNGLLALSFGVKWVRSDTAQPPLVRSQELALEALETFRRTTDTKGIVRSLLAACPMADPRARESMMTEAATLVESIADENYRAMVLVAGARSLAMADRVQASDMQRQALEIYKRTGNQKGQAQCLFSLAIVSGTDTDSRDSALEAARLFRVIGDTAEAARSMTLALMNAQRIQPLSELEDLAQQGLQDALAAGNRTMERSFYTKLALIAASNGQIEQADKYRRWATDLEEADGRTPLERWKDNIEMNKMMISMAKDRGNKELANVFKEELKRLKAAKPK